MEFDLTLVALLTGAAFIAGLVDSIAGGGGLIALPSLLLAGLDPVAALATNKLQGTFGTASATYAFWKKGLLKPKEHIIEIISVLIGSALGVLAVKYVSTETLKFAMPAVLVAVALYFALAPNLSNIRTTPKISASVFGFLIAPVIGFYDGIFGPGTGSFFMLALVALLGLGIVEATGRTKLLNFTSNIAALLVFAIGGKIVWMVGLPMGLAQFAGAQIGARLAISNGAKIIRPLLVIMCVAMAVRLYMNA
jgi:uncharacterized protein